MPLPIIELITSAARPHLPMALTSCVGSRTLTWETRGDDAAKPKRQCPAGFALLRLTHALAYQERRIRAGPRAEFLRSAVIHFGEVKIAIGVDAHPVYVPQGSGPIALAAPGIEIAPVDIELDDLGRTAVCDPDAAVGGHVQELRSRRLSGAPLIEELAVFIEDLDAMIGAIGHEDAVGLRVENHAMHVFENSGARIVRRIRRLAKGHQELAVLVKLHHARIAVSVGDTHRPVP